MYLRIDEGAPTHRKTLALGRVLGNPEALTFMIRLWTWACRSSPKGDLAGIEPGDIEEIARWRGAPGAFYAGAVAVGFIDELSGGGRVLHDWDDWTGGDIEEMAAEARRKWWFRRHNASPRTCGGVDGKPDPCPICTRQSSGGPSADGRKTSTVDKTSPGKTRQGKTRSEEEKGTPPGKTGRPPTLFDELLETFGKAWRTQYHEPYTPTPADRSQLGRLLQALKEPDEATALPALFESYLRDDDAFVAEKQRHSLAYFCTSGGLNKYRTKPAVSSRARAGSAAQREASNAAAAAAFVARGGGANGAR